MTFVDTQIFLGNVTKWNAEEIAQLNPDIATELPNTNIQVVYRTGSSGTNKMLSRALTAFLKSFPRSERNSLFGNTTQVEWPDECDSLESF